MNKGYLFSFSIGIKIKSALIAIITSCLGELEFEELDKLTHGSSKYNPLHSSNYQLAFKFTHITYGTKTAIPLKVNPDLKYRAASTQAMESHQYGN